MEINITELPTNGNQSSSCENCAAYKENAERAYEAVQKFAQTRQEAINLQKQVKDLNTVLQDRQEYVVDLKNKLEAEKERSARFEQQLGEKKIELDYTKEQLEFVKAEADKNKELAEKTVNHEKKLNDMQKQFEEMKESHSKTCKRMFNLANTVQNYQKRYGVLNLTQVPDDQPSTSFQSVDEPSELKTIKPRRGRAAKTPKNKPTKKSKPDQVSRSNELSKEALMAELDSSDDLNSAELVIDEEEPFDEEPKSSENGAPSTEPAQTGHSNELNKEALMAELDSSDDDLSSIELVIDEEEPFDEEPKRDNDDLSDFNL
ncbi:hypothetical protein M3Y97_00459300 [Aphelenchoides bicaudatus]|nr:hypothetical protein M3Y97_00459300 [Aphelenchoides bicaudatus]